MTEQEAKTKWCPQSTSGDYRPDPNNAGKEVRHPLCIGSACMAWRWDSVGMEYEHAGYGGRERGKGHCGLAGQP